MGGSEDVSDRERSEESDSGEDNIDGGGGSTTEYEKQRLLRIRQNKERMEALGLVRRMNHAEKSRQVKYAAEEDDEEYIPCHQDESGASDSSDYDVTTNSRSRSRSRSRQMKKKISTPRKKASENTMDCSEFVDEDKVLMQAIALSLQDSQAVSVVPHAGTSVKSNVNINEINDDTRKRKKRGKVPIRVQMTEDDVVIHFCQFDVVGKGSISKRDLQRMAACHDFIWTDKEFDDMIRCFDCNGDGKLSLDEFRKIVSRCGMLQGVSA